MYFPNILVGTCIYVLLAPPNPYPIQGQNNKNNNNNDNNDTNIFIIYTVHFQNLMQL